MLDWKEFGLDEDGFVPRDQLRYFLCRRGLGVLGRTPALVVQEPEAAPVGERAAPADDLSYKRTMDGDRGETGRISLGIERYYDRVAFLTKRPGNPFPNMVNVGRAANCDIHIFLGTVSKVHGYFMLQGEEWGLLDQRSKNGTFVNGLGLTPGERRPLAEGDRIRFGSDLTAVFLYPEALGRLLSV